MPSTISSVDFLKRTRVAGAVASRHRLVRRDSFHVARDPIRRGLLTYVLKQRTAVAIDQEKFENVIDGSIGFALSNHVESRHHVVDLLGRSGQEQPAVNVGALLVRICEKLGRVIVFGIDCDRHDAGLGSEPGPEAIRDLFHLRRKQKTRSGTGGVNEIEQHRLPFQRGQGNVPAVLIDQRDVGEAFGGIAHLESSALINLFRMLAATDKSHRAHDDNQHRQTEAYPETPLPEIKV